MTYDAQIQMRKASVRPVYAQISGPSGDTITIQNGGTFTLYDQTGAVVSGFNGVPVSGWDGGAVQSADIWYVLNASTLNPENLSTCVYSAIFSVPAVGSDGIARTFKVDVQINVVPFVEVLATYDETQLTTSPLYQVRLYITDVDMTQPTFTDAEIQFFINSNSGNTYLAAAVALEAAATTSAYLANTVKIGSFGSGEVDVYRALMERAKRFRNIAIVPPTVDSPDQMFVPNYVEQGGSKGTMNPW